MAIFLSLIMMFGALLALASARMVVSLYALALGAGPGEVGLMIALFSVGQMLFALPVGLTVERLGARRLMVAGCLAGTGAFALAWAVGQIWVLYVASFFIGVWFTSTFVTVQNLIGLLSTPQDMTRNFANFALSGSIGHLIAPLLAGAVIDHFGHANACLLVVGIGLALCALLALRGAALPGPRAPDPVRAPVRAMLTDRAVWQALWQSAALEFAMEVVPFLVTLYGHSLGFSATEIGFTLAGSAVSTLTVRALLPRIAKRVGEERLLRGSLVTAALGIALFPFFVTPAGLAGAAVLYGMGVGCAFPLTVMLVFKRSPKGASAPVAGLRATGSSFLRLFGPGLGGAAGALLGMLPVFLAVAALLVSSALVLGRRAPDGAGR